MAGFLGNDQKKPGTPILKGEEMTSYIIGKYEIQRDRERRRNRKHARFMRISRWVLLIEMAVIIFEGMYRFGEVVRGYPSFGGESLVLMALIGVSAWKIRKIIK